MRFDYRLSTIENLSHLYKKLYNQSINRINKTVIYQRRKRLYSLILNYLKVKRSGLISCKEKECKALIPDMNATFTIG